jgi:thiol-disulfide isomerase/thioredoxin/outer membrane lipoprotein-sorting protein
MRRALLISTSLAMIGSAVGFAQSTPLPSGLELLKRVAERYSGADSYNIGSVEERTTHSQYSHGWQKTILVAAAAPGNRYYYEGHAEDGSAIRVADGKTVWTYHLEEHRYTVKPQLGENSDQASVTPFSERAMRDAEDLKTEWSDLAKSLKSAQRLPDATLWVKGHPVSCNLVHVRTSDLRRLRSDFSFDETLWIDKAHETILRKIEHENTYLLIGAGRIPMQEDIATTFNTTLNGPVTDKLYTFIPPSSAKVVQDFPDPKKDLEASSMAGEQLPSLKLKSADGKVVSLDAFRGKPVLLDFWATWCGPCVAALPQLARIYEETKGKSLVFLAVDEDEEARTASDFLSKKGYGWSNFHDDGEVEQLMQTAALPHTVLVDSSGKIIYDTYESNEDDLRIRIAKLGPEYSSLLPKAKRVPCVATK